MSYDPRAFYLGTPWIGGGWGQAPPGFGWGNPQAHTAPQPAPALGTPFDPTMTAQDRSALGSIGIGDPEADERRRRIAAFDARMNASTQASPDFYVGMSDWGSHKGYKTNGV